MTRVKTGPYRRRRHRKIIKRMQGQFGSRHRLWRRANEAMLKSYWYAYRDRRARKRVCLLYTSPSPRAATISRMPSSA